VQRRAGYETEDEAQQPDNQEDDRNQPQQPQHGDPPSTSGYSPRQTRAVPASIVYRKPVIRLLGNGDECENLLPVAIEVFNDESHHVFAGSGIKRFPCEHLSVEGRCRALLQCTAHYLDLANVPVVGGHSPATRSRAFRQGEPIGGIIGLRNGGTATWLQHM